MGEARTKMMLGAAGAAALAAQMAAAPGKIVRAQRCENCKNGIEGPGIAPDQVQCHGGPPTAQAIFVQTEKGMQQIGMATSWPMLKKDDPNSWCDAWKPRLVT